MYCINGINNESSRGSPRVTENVGSEQNGSLYHHNTNNVSETMNNVLVVTINHRTESNNKQHQQWSAFSPLSTVNITIRTEITTAEINNQNNGNVE